MSSDESFLIEFIWAHYIRYGDCLCLQVYFSFSQSKYAQWACMFSKYSLSWAQVLKISCITLWEILRHTDFNWTPIVNLLEIKMKDFKYLILFSSLLAQIYKWNRVQHEICTTFSCAYLWILAHMFNFILYCLMFISFFSFRTSAVL
jgi:hypothetical protein